MFLVSHSSAGGAQEIWANLAEGFRARGHAVQLVALYPLRQSMQTRADGLSWRHVADRQPRTPLQSANLLRSLIRIIRQDRPAIIFTAMPAANVAASLATRVAGGPTRVITSHHSPVETHSKLLNRIDGIAGTLKSVKTVISVSDVVGTSLDGKPASYRAKRRTIKNALPPRIEALLDDLAARHAPRSARSRTVVATGRLHMQKNYPLLIRAAALMPDVTINIVGNGPDEEALRSLANDLGVQGRVHFLGHRPREEALAILAEGDIFAQVSLFEGHSLGLIEAARLGLPLVVSDVPVQIEGITAADGQSCGLTVGTGDAEALARSITLLLDDSVAYGTWANRARKLGSEATYEAMMAAYEELVA